jgi:hypothetical protein
MKKWKVLILIGVLLINLLTACNLPSMGSEISVEDLVATSVQQTQNVASGDQEETEADVPDAPPATATLTLQPSDTATATVTLTPTQEKPMVSVSVDTNCRSGPGTIYDWIGGLLVGERAEVVGRSVDGKYWIIKNPDQAGTCWLWANYATVTGQTSGLAQYTPPPTPTPAFYWSGNWTTYIGNEGGPYLPYLLSVTVDEKDFTGLIDLGGGDTVNLTGTIEDDYLSVSGTWVGPTMSGSFTFFAFGIGQFQGNYDNGFAMSWCGTKGGAPAPSPCGKY